MPDTIEPAVAWAKKMADVLGKRIGDSASSPSKGGGGAPTANGTPAANDTPSRTPANGTPTGGGVPTPVDAPFQAPPTGHEGPTATSASAPAGSGAKEQAEAAKKALSDIKPVVAELVTVNNELKKLIADAQAAKKEVDDTSRKVDESEKAIPAPSPVQKPQGADAKSQYDSSIQITGSVRKVLGDAEGKLTDGQTQAGAAEEAQLKVDVAVQKLQDIPRQVIQLAAKVDGYSSSAQVAASQAASIAAESKQKADKAAKDNAADKNTLMKAAQEDAKYATEAKQAAANAKTAVTQVGTSVTSVETQVKAATKLQEGSRATAEAAKKKAGDLFRKLEPHFEALGKAESQEAECRAKLSAEDADSVLNQRYIALGGDPELTQVLAAEDQEFEAGTEIYRAELKRWQTQKKKEIDDYKTWLEGILSNGEPYVESANKFLATESPLAEKAASSAQALGEKLQTEPGKELMQLIDSNNAVIAKAKRTNEFNKKLLEKTMAALDATKKSYEDLDKQYEAGETFLKERRTELDNLLQMQSMSLEVKVDILQTRPKPVRDKIKVQLDAELDRLARMTILENQLEPSEHQPPVEPPKRDPLDWKSVDAMIAKISAATLEQLKANDPKLADIQAEYDQAGGDQALLDKRMAKWKEATEEATLANKGRADSFKSNSEKLRTQLVNADAKMRDVQENLMGARDLYAVYSQQHQYLHDALQKDPASISNQDRAELDLKRRELERLRTQIKSLEAELDTARASKASAEKLIEAERQRYEQSADDERYNLPKPTSAEINATPLRAKYTELTGKQPPK